MYLRSIPATIRQGLIVTEISMKNMGLPHTIFAEPLTLYADGVPRNRSNISMSGSWIKGRRILKDEV